MFRRKRTRRVPLSLSATSLLCTLLAAGPGQAQNGPPPVDPDRLKTLEREIDSRIERREALDAEAREIAREVAGLRTRLIETADRVRDRERAVTDSEDRLAGLTAAETVLAARLEQRGQQVGALLAALQRIDRNPPPALAVKPDDVLGAIRSAMLLGKVVPELEAEAAELRDRVRELADIRRQSSQERQTLRTEGLALTAERAALQALLDRKQAAEVSLRAAAEIERRALDRLSREAGTLKELIAKLEARAATRTPPPRPAVRRPAPGPAPPRPQADRGPSFAALSPPDIGTGRPGAGMRFAQARGLIRLPAEGKLVNRFGETDNLGGRHRGVTVRTRPSAQITALFDGRIVFAGPFRQYGQLLIISVGEGYHVLMAGMARISGTVGQAVLAGEPVGRMASDPVNAAFGAGVKPDSNPGLYIEFRRNGEPIDPGPWLTASDRKARG